ncbi:MAG: hypothetical protein FJ041_00025 [Candidatus Cloacimonetes bacterium]|nr:hypothetical protein [Candidatus Cloacimonadota bacterium]
MKTLSKPISIQPLWASYIQCLKAMSDYLELKHSAAWICGTTGYAFIMNIHPTLCPSGPTAFSQLPLNALAANLGFDLYGMSLSKNAPDFKVKQEEAWTSTQMAIDNDMPTLGWELNMPEFYMIYGYDKENYLFHELDSSKNKKKWNTLGVSRIGWLCLFSAVSNDAKATTQKLLKDTFGFVLDFARKNKDWTYPDYANGIKAYDIWMDSLRSNKFEPMGLAYNSQVWSECRSMAVEFLKEAKKKMRTKLLDNLIEHYDVVSWSLQKVAKLFPMNTEEVFPEQIDSAIDNLFLAKEAEKAALVEMKLLLSHL